MADTTERLRHMPMVADETAVTGLRFCVVCDEAWPCATRTSASYAHAFDLDHEHLSYADPSIHPEQGASDDW